MLVGCCHDEFFFRREARRTPYGAREVVYGDASVLPVATFINRTEGAANGEHLFLAYEMAGMAPSRTVPTEEFRPGERWEREDVNVIVERCVWCRCWIPSSIHISNSIVSTLRCESGAGGLTCYETNYPELRSILCKYQFALEEWSLSSSAYTTFHCCSYRRSKTRCRKPQPLRKLRVSVC